MHIILIKLYYVVYVREHNYQYVFIKQISFTKLQYMIRNVLFNIIHAYNVCFMQNVIHADTTFEYLQFPQEISVIYNEIGSEVCF